MNEAQIESTNALTDMVIEALEDLKALDIKTINVVGKSSMTDVIIIATGRSTTHVKAISNSVIQKAKSNNHQPLGTEGDTSLEWMLVDLNDVVVHIMLQDIRDFYNLEKLWETSAESAESNTHALR